MQTQKKCRLNAIDYSNNNQVGYEISNNLRKFYST